MSIETKTKSSKRHKYIIEKISKLRYDLYKHSLSFAIHC